MEEIKIDKTFTKELVFNEDDEMIVRLIVDLAHNLGLKVVAEGVQNQKTYDKLKFLGADEAQGYYISPPVSAKKISRLMKKINPITLDINDINP